MFYRRFLTWGPGLCRLLAFRPCPASPDLCRFKLLLSDADILGLPALIARACGPSSAIRNTHCRENTPAFIEGKLPLRSRPRAGLRIADYRGAGARLWCPGPIHFLTQETSKAFALVIPSFPTCLSVVKGTKVSAVLSAPRQVTMAGSPILDCGLLVCYILI